MKMLKKEIITIIIILIIVIGINFITDKIMSKTVYEIKDIITKIGEELNNKEVDENNVKKLNDMWNEKEIMLSYFAEHDELEKITKEIKSLNVNLEGDEEEAKVEIEQIKFLLNHIQEKNKLKLKNVF